MHNSTQSDPGQLGPLGESFPNDTWCQAQGPSISPSAARAALGDLLCDLLRPIGPDVEAVDPLGLWRPVEDGLLLRLQVDR
eukprot:scaffold51202_cov65-Phaeocystis_antarctica.AAC.2